MAATRVLVVEDERIVALHLRQQLGRLGYDVTAVASSGEQALRQLAVQQPDVVLMDIHIEGAMDGIETARRIPEASQVPIVYLTAYSEEATLARARSTKPYGYLLKPFSERELHATIQMALERRTVEIALRESEERLRLALDAGEMGSWELDLVTRTILSTEQTDRIVGCSPKSGRSSWAAFLDRVEIEDRPLVIASLDRALAVDAQYQVEFRSRRSDGQRWLRAQGKSFTSRPDGAKRVVGVLGDITGHRLAQEALRQANDLLEQRVAERTADLAAARAAAEAANEAKSQFLATMSHELRTPLTGLIGFADLLLRGDFEPSGLRRYLNLQRDAARTLQVLIDDILDLSKIEAGKLELETVAFEPRALVAACEVLVGHSAATKGLGFHTAVDPAVPAWLEGDPTRLRQVMLNILTNAVKFTETGGIDLVVRIAGAGPSRLRISVKDTGIGIPTDKLGRLFQPFSQVDASTSRRFGGSGLGLAICNRLIELMGGEIGVESQNGRGSEFWFEVPLVSAVAPQAASTEDATSLDGGTPRRILLAEDSATIQILVSSILELAGHQVEIVANGAEAVRAASLDAFDLILMDLHMPVMDGFEAVRRIRAAEAAGRRIPIVALTANVMSGDVERCRAAGTDDFLAKPINMDQLLATIARFGNGHQ